MAGYQLNFSAPPPPSYTSSFSPGSLNWDTSNDPTATAYKGAADIAMAPGSSGNIGQLSMSGEPLSDGGSFDWGTVGSAGVAAAGKTASLISDAVNAQQQREFTAEQAGLDRATRQKLVSMQLKESAWEANQGRQQDAYKMMMQAYSNQIANTYNSLANKRTSANAMDSLLASAMLRRPQ